MEKAINMLQRLRVLGNVSLQYAYSQRHQLEKWYVKAAATLLLLLGLLTAAANVWCVGSLNRKYIPQACAQAEVLLERKVGLGRVKWVAPSGLVGLGPLAAVGPVELGPGSAERSSIALQQVIVRVDPLQSLVQRKLVVQLHADAPQVSLVQADNFSWFGFPDDTEPSARNLFPGLAKAVDSDIAQHLLPSMLGGDQDQPLAGNAARLSSKVAKAEARRSLAPAPDSALNFRPAVGADLELVSKDERELSQSRAELEALIRQQRSAQASSAESPPSTSSPAPVAPQPPQWHSRSHHRDTPHSPKQATRPQHTHPVSRGAQQPSPAHSKEPGSAQLAGAAASGSTGATAAGFSATATGGPSPFASISGQGAPGGRRKPGRSGGQPPGSSAAAAAADARSSSGQAGAGEYGASPASFGNGSSIGSPGAQGSGGADAGVSSSDSRLEEAVQGSNGPSVLQPANGDLPAMPDVPGSSLEAQAADRSQLPRTTDTLQRSESNGEQIKGKGAPSKHRSTAEEDNSVHSMGSGFLAQSDNGELDGSGAQRGHPTAGKPESAQTLSRVASVRWLRPRSGMAPPLQVRKGRPLDALQRAPAAAQARSQNTAQKEDTALLVGDTSSASQEDAVDEAAPVELEEQPHAVTAVDAGVNDVSQLPIDDPAPEDADGVAAAATSQPQPSEEGGSAPAPAAIAASSAAVPPQSEPSAQETPTADEVFSSLIRQRQERRAGRERPQWSSRSWDAKWYGGPEGEAHAHGGRRADDDWQPPRQSLRRTARSRLRHGRSTVKDPHQTSWVAQEKPAPSEAAAARASFDAARTAEQHELAPAAELEATDALQPHDPPSLLENGERADSELSRHDDSTVTAEETAKFESHSGLEEGGIEPEMSAATAAESGVAEGGEDDAGKRRLPWQRQRLAGPFGASPLEGLRRRFLEVLSSRRLAAPDAQQQSKQAPADEQASQEAAESAADSQDLRVGTTGFLQGDDALQHFSLHRSHRKMWVSTAETAAAAEERERQVLPAEALLAERLGNDQLQFSALQSTQVPSKTATVPDQPAAVAPAAELPIAAVPEQDSKTEEEVQLTGTDLTTEQQAEENAGVLQEPSAAEECSRGDESAAAADAESAVDVSAQHMQEDSPAPQSATEEAETTEAPVTVAEYSSEAEAPVEADTPPETIAEAEPEDEPAAQPIAEAEKDPAASEGQPLQQLEPEEPAPPAPVVTMEASALEAAAEELAALQQDAKPDATALAAAAAAVAPATAAPAAAGPESRERASSKAKHSWQSPALSARYGEVADDEPRYKPRSPTVDASAMGGVRAWAAKRIGAVLASLQPPDVALNVVSIRGGDLYATLTGESIPRRVQNIDLKLRLGRDYRSLTLDLTGLAHERNSASDKCTMINPDGQRHLRDVPSAPIVRSFAEVPQPASAQTADQAARADGSAAEDALTFSTGTRPRQWEAQLQDVAKKHLDGRDGSRVWSDSGDADTPYGADITITKTEEKRQSWLGGDKSARPTGGRVRLRLNVKELGDPDRLANLDLTIWGDNLHAPIIERIVELPMDIYAGRVNGKLRISANDKETWKFPAIRGRVRGSDLAFHFFDAPDDFSRTKLDLIFEGDRLYFHGAQGFFGAVPITLNGDMDINPETGQYRLSASVPGVEANDLRRTLAIRPTPFPIGGAVRGVLHCTGPLETPVFSGTAVAMAPSKDEVDAMEDSCAKDTLRECPSAAGAYDRVPFASASAVWTLDTSTDIFLLHSLQAEPLGGGQVVGSGRMWVSPAAEMDPRAVRVQLEGCNLPTESLIKRYLPKGAPLPAAMELGESSVRGTMAGSMLAPDLHMRWEAPAASASGSADFSREANRFTCRAPSLDVSGALFLRPPPFDAVKAVLTQAEATALAQPQLEGADIDCDFKGLDVLPIAAALERGSAAKAQRLKLNGRAKFSVRLTPTPDLQADQGGKDQQQETQPSAFAGDLTLDGLRMNQLKLSRNLTGTVLLSQDRFQIRAKGQRPDETLDVNLKLPFAPGSSGKAASLAPTNGAAPAGTAAPGPPAATGTGGALLGRRRAGLGGLGTLLPVPRFGGAAAPPSLLPQSAAAAADAPGAGADSSQGGNFMLRCGQLLMSAEVNAEASRVECAVQGLLLDELELASLRGEVQEALLSLNLESRIGRAVVSVAGPRFSGLQGQSLSGAFRWERDVVRLERAVLQQANSRYEVQGEYVIPSSATIPRSAAEMAAEMAAVQGAAAAHAANAKLAPFETGGGRWRLQVNVPTANMEEILPAARLLSRATALSPSDYERAKALFLSGVDASNLAAQELGRQLEAAAQAARMAMEADATNGGRASSMQEASDESSPSSSSAAAPEAAAARGGGGKSGGGGGNAPRGTLPGLQDLRGQWSGGVQAYGGGGGATNVDFNVRGQDWQWGDYGLDQVVANGSCHSIEGIKLEELGLKAGEAKLLVRGSLLGAVQDASIILTDFPVAVLQPLFRALPALEHAMPAVAASGGPGGGSTGGSLGGLAVPFLRGGHLRSRLHRSYSVGLANSPVNGLLYVRGTLGGSAAVPEGEVVVRLYDGAIGPTYLAQAQAQASLDAAQQLSFSADLAPAEAGRHSGHVRVSGNIPLHPSPALPGNGVPVSVGAEAAKGGTSKAEELEVRVSVKDGGMMLVTALTPDLRWQSGAAELSMRVHGPPSRPQVEGNAHFAKAAMACPWLKYPLTNLGGTVRLADNALKIEGLEAHVGRRGRIRVKGGLPLTADAAAPPDLNVQVAGADGGAKSGGSRDSTAGALIVDVQGLELRLRNVYTGYLDAGLKLQNSLTAPAVGGDVRLSRGVASLMPGGPSPPGSSGSSSGAGQPSSGAASDGGRARETDLVFKAFTVLTGKDALARQLSRFDMQQAGEAAMQPVAQAVSLKGLKLHLGPELRAMFPVVLNMSISGDVELNGAADPASLKLAGIIHLDGGELNLVATQLVLDREHPNRLVFSPSRGLDPLLDLRLKGAQVQALIQGRASAWQQNLVLTPTKAGAGEAGGATEAAEAARIFEGQLAGALVAEDGQLALSNLAASAAHGFMPKIQTQGQLGQARWRLVSAPSIPGLLSLDPSGDPSSLLSSLTMGTEVEVHFGRSLQAAMARKLRDSDIATQWTLNYQLNSKLRMQFNIASSSPYPRTLIFQYSSETNPPPLPR